MLNFIFLKLTQKKMKKKDDITLHSTRLKSGKENKSIPAHPMYSAGEDFYSIFHDEKKPVSENNTKISANKRA